MNGKFSVKFHFSSLIMRIFKSNWIKNIKILEECAIELELVLTHVSLVFKH